MLFSLEDPDPITGWLLDFDMGILYAGFLVLR